MRDRDVVTVHRVGVCGFLRSSARVLVNDQLMAVEVEVDPVLGRSSFGQAEDFTIKAARDCRTVGGDLIRGTISKCDELAVF